jgi:hypothetical protein
VPGVAESGAELVNGPKGKLASSPPQKKNRSVIPVAQDHGAALLLLKETLLSNHHGC